MLDWWLLKKEIAWVELRILGDIGLWVDEILGRWDFYFEGESEKCSYVIFIGFVDYRF